MESSILIRRSFSELGFDPEFCAQAEKMGLFQLEEALSLAPAELLALPGFSYHWLSELIDFLNKNGLLHLLQSIPGKSYD